MSKSILSAHDSERLRQAVLQAERNTSGEIVPVVTASSDSYPGARWRLAVGIAALGTALFFWFGHALELWWLPLLQLLSLSLGHLLARFPAVLRLALSRAEITEEVRQLAREQFLMRGVHQTRDRTGILLLVSLLEHRIELICDSGIDSKAPDGYWNDVVHKLVVQVKGGALVEGLLEAIEQMGELLAVHFPSRDDDTNELADAPVEL